MAVAAQDALLLVSTDNAESLAVQLRDNGYQVAIANTELRAVALLFLMRSFSAVVIDGREHESASFDLASRLHAIRAAVPIIVIGRQLAGSSSASVDACVTEKELPETLTVLLKAPAHSVAAAARREPLQRVS